MVSFMGAASGAEAIAKKTPDAMPEDPINCDAVIMVPAIISRKKRATMTDNKVAVRINKIERAVS